MKRSFTIVPILVLVFTFSACNMAAEKKQQELERQQALQEARNKAALEEMIGSFENPPDPTDPGTVQLEIPEGQTLLEALQGEWEDADGTGLIVEFTKDTYYMSYSSTKRGKELELRRSCDGDKDDNGPYIWYRDGEYEDCFLVVELSGRRLRMEDQASRITVTYKRKR